MSKYYISKPVTHKVDPEIIKKIREMDHESEIVKRLEDADVCVFQAGWTKSGVCADEFLYASEHRIRIKDGFL